VLAGSTIDTLLPPIAFAIVNALYGLDTAVISAFILAILLGVFRLVRKQPWGYALAGLLAVGLAAWASHLTRGWLLDWYWREDIKPAYRDVSWIWALFFAMRLVIQIILFQQGEVATLAWANTLLGWPVTIFVLVLSMASGGFAG